MEQKVKMSQEDIEKLKKLQEEYNKKIYEFGRLTQARIELDNQLEELNVEDNKLRQEYKKLQEQETKLAEELEKKYGKGQVNLETGEFTKI